MAKTKEKNPAAVELGRLGGKKGGKARARKLSAKERKAIAMKGVRARMKLTPEQRSIAAKKAAATRARNRAAKK